MPDQTDGYELRIRTLWPDLEIRSVERNSEGLLNDVLIVNRELAFRFARNEQARAFLASEVRVLRAIEGHLSLPIPAPVHVEKDLMVYPFIEGKALTRTAMLAAGARDRQRMAAQVGRFLADLHAVPPTPDIPNTLAPVTREAWQGIRHQVEDRVYPLLLPHQIDWAQSLFDRALAEPGFFDCEPAVIHGDLAPYHILFRENGEGIQGIIDFGVAGIGDPANDLATLLQFYGESVVELILQHYPGGRQHLDRARFYAQAIELQWALLGIETGEAFWFTAHLGGARDIGNRQREEAL